MPGRDIIVVGTLAGGVEALRVIVGGLPKDFKGSVFVVMHTAPDSPGVLGQILDRWGPLHAANARNHERVKPGRIYVAPPDNHLLLEPGVVRITHGPKENRFRPAIDPLFRSAAQTYGPASSSSSSRAGSTTAPRVCMPSSGSAARPSCRTPKRLPCPRCP